MPGDDGVKGDHDADNRLPSRFVSTCLAFSLVSSYTQRALLGIFVLIGRDFFLCIALVSKYIKQFVVNRIGVCALLGQGSWLECRC